MQYTKKYNIPYPELKDKANIPEDMKKMANSIDNGLDSIQKKIDDIIMSGDTNAEVVDARGEFETLGKRLNNVDKNITISTKPFETNCFIADSANSKIKFDKIIGGLVQEGEPSLANPSELKYVGGNYDIEVSNNDESEKQIYPLDLSNRNILNCTTPTTTLVGVTVAKNNDGTYTLNGTATDNGILFLAKNIPINGEYTYSCAKGGSDNTYWARVVKYVGSATSGGSVLGIDVGEGITFNADTSESGYTYSFDISFKKGMVFDNVTIYPMLTKGSQALSYQPYVAPYNYLLYSDKDYIYKKDNKLYVNNDFDKVNAKDLSWSMNEVQLEGVTYKQFYTKTTFEPQKKLQNCIGKIFSNTFHVPSTPNTKGNYMYIGNTGLLVCVAPKNANGNYITTLDQWKTAIQDTYFVGKLATPTETEIQGESEVVEAELLYKQLEALYNMKTYKGGTHITFDDIGKIQGEYIVDNGLAEAVREFNEINGYVDEARVIELINQYK